MGVALISMCRSYQQQPTAALLTGAIVNAAQAACQLPDPTASYH
jgi:hypothetical protein